MTSLAGITVQDADGADARLGALIARPAAGAAALGISVGAAHQARWLMEEQGIRFPLLVDRERRFYDAIDLPQRWWVGLNPRGWINYARALARGSRQGSIVAPNQLPGLVVVDEQVRPVSIHRGRTLGDYPPLDWVLAEVGRTWTSQPAPA